MKATKPYKKGQKRVAIESKEEESSKESEPRVKKKQCTKQQHAVEVSNDEVDTIEDVEPMEKGKVEDVDVAPNVDDKLLSDIEVSTDSSLEWA